jgi:hypothetical protein
VDYGAVRRDDSQSWQTGDLGKQGLTGGGEASAVREHFEEG